VPSRIIDLAVISALITLGCTARIAGTADVTDAPPAPVLTGGSGSGGSTSLDPPAGGSMADCATPRVAYAPLKRLTRAQYDNTVRDLLGETGAPSSGLAQDEKLAAFYTNAVSPVTRLSVEQYADVAEQLARRAVAQGLDTLVGCSGAAQNADCAEAFVRAFGQRAFRRPPSEDEVARYRGLFEKHSARGFETGVRLVLQAMLQSPSFVYHLELTPGPDGADVVPVSGYELAARLSYALWNSAPDPELLDAAGTGALNAVQGLRSQAERLLKSDRARDAVASFHLQWLGLEGKLDGVKDSASFPAWGPSLVRAMEQETVDFADFVVRRGDGRLQTLLSAPFTVAGPEVLSLYGVSAAPAPDGTVALDPTERAGLLTQAAFLSAHAHSNQTSPVHRGLAVRKNLLCTELPDPPMNVDNTPPEPDPTATTRQRFEQHRTNASCAGCHRLLDPIGVGFESYDAIGAYRVRENGLEIDATGELLDAGSASGTFNGAVELAQRLSTSSAVRDCVQKQWFRFSLGRFEGDEDSCTMQRLSEAFAASDYDVKALLLELVTSDAFRYRKVTP
jgi:hypothetical protein